MADLETLQNTDSIAKLASEPKPPGKSVRVLALAAIDEAYQERLKTVFENFDASWENGDVSGATDRARDAFQRIGAVRLRMRQFAEEA